MNTVKTRHGHTDLQPYNREDVMDPQRQGMQEEQALPCHLEPILRAPCASKAKSFLHLLELNLPWDSTHSIAFHGGLLLSPVHCDPLPELSDTFTSLQHYHCRCSVFPIRKHAPRKLRTVLLL